MLEQTYQDIGSRLSLQKDLSFNIILLLFLGLKNNLFIVVVITTNKWLLHVDTKLMLTVTYFKNEFLI